MVFGKKPINCKFGDLEEAKSLYTQTSALTGTNGITTIHREILAFMVPGLIIVESSIASAGMTSVKLFGMGSFNDTLYNIKSRLVLSISTLFKKYPQ